MSQNGKGSRPRPKSVDQKTWDKNYERIFRKKEDYAQCIEVSGGSIFTA